MNKIFTGSLKMKFKIIAASIYIIITTSISFAKENSYWHYVGREGDRLMYVDLNNVSQSGDILRLKIAYNKDFRMKKASKRIDKKSFEWFGSKIVEAKLDCKLGTESILMELEFTGLFGQGSLVREDIMPGNDDGETRIKPDTLEYAMKMYVCSHFM